MKKSIIITIILLFVVLVSSSFAVEVTLLGPKQYLRVKGKPYVVKDAFPGEFGAGTLIIENGTLSDTNRVSSATIKVNNQEVCNTKDFNLEVFNLELPINLIDSNTISVELRSEVGSYLTIQIIQEIDADASTVIGSEGGILEVNDVASPIFGYNITIPSGALDEPIVISLKHLPGFGVLSDSEKVEGIDFPSFQILPAGQELNDFAEIRIPYSDVDNDGIFDGTNIMAKSGSIFYNSEGMNDWVRVDTMNDEENNVLIANTHHFSKWDAEMERWKSGIVKYYINSVPFNPQYPQFDEATFRNEIFFALQRWSDAIDNEVTFEEVSNVVDADIELVADNLCHFPHIIYPDNCEATGIAHKLDINAALGGVLWKVFFNNKPGDFLPWIWINGSHNYLNWPQHGGGTGFFIPFMWTALHELGHVMGLPDYLVNEPTCNSWNEDRNDWNVMFYNCPNEGGNLQPVVTLGDFDISEVRELYGLPIIYDSYEFLLKWGTQGIGNGQFNDPMGIEVSPDGYIYVADTSNDRIQKFDSNGNFITKWGSHGSGDGEFWFPLGIGVDSFGNVYVADIANERIQKFDSNGNFITKWGTEGWGNGEFNDPFDVAVSSGGDVYVADSFNFRIQKFDSNGNFITKWGTWGIGDGEFDDPAGIAIDSIGNVYVADNINNRIQKFDSDGNFITKWGSHGSGDGEFLSVNGITVDSEDNIYVAGGANNRIQKFDSNGNFITKWGTEGFGDGQFRGPRDIAVDSYGNVYVVDHHNNRIQKFR